ncbi:hypothetical protein CEXT_248071 [Caerostris extrusa]|uniref:Uncharacterized protein n=1 Tax=Caerostris extrusa TaxID=172846 RepID=A0AAV4XRY4_CAEEX|nr:hypothetical protein CEXT_248071 [Caerostris extrusa]
MCRNVRSTRTVCTSRGRFNFYESLIFMHPIILFELSCFGAPQLLGNFSGMCPNLRQRPIDHQLQQVVFLCGRGTSIEEEREGISYGEAVVFGVTSSPFLLGAVLDCHINQYAALKPFVLSGLSKSFSEDNLVTGVDNEVPLEEFMTDANDILNKGGFELRDWTFTSTETNKAKSLDLLGLRRDTHLDVIAFSVDWIEDIRLEIITKRTMLSIDYSIFWCCFPWYVVPQANAARNMKNKDGYYCVVMLLYCARIWYSSKHSERDDFTHSLIMPGTREMKTLSHKSALSFVYLMRPFTSHPVEGAVSQIIMECMG